MIFLEILQRLFTSWKSTNW